MSLVEQYLQEHLHGIKSESECTVENYHNMECAVAE
jgi:hypothetical protein